MIHLFENDESVYAGIVKDISRMMNKSMKDFDGHVVPGSFIDFINESDSVEGVELIGSLSDEEHEILWELFRYTMKTGEVYNILAGTNIISD